MADNIFGTYLVDKDISGREENPEDKISNEVKKASVGATHVVYEIIYDRSGSMLNMPTAPEALQNFVNQQREFCKENNITTKFTLTVFDTVAEKVPKLYLAVMFHVRYLKSPFASKLKYSRRGI